MTASTSAFPGPDDVHRERLENGFTVLIRENPSAPVALLEGYLRTGSVYEPASQAGLAAFTASLTTRGSERYDFDTFNETVESMGASVTVGAGSHTLGFGSESLTEDFPRVLDVLADVLRRPTFPQQHVDRLRGQWLVHLQEQAQDTRTMAYRRLNELVFGDHPYGRSSSGTPETIEALTRDDVATFHEEEFDPQEGVIVVCGDVETGRVLDLLKEYFGDWNRGSKNQEIGAPQEPVQSHREQVVIPGKIQSDIVIGAPAIERTHPDYFAVQVANHILGRFGLMGRLGEEVRERQGLAYYSYSFLDTDEKAGLWIASAGVNPTNVDQAISAVLKEFERLANEPVSAEELSDSQANMTGSMPLRLETNGGVASTLLNIERFDLGLDYLEEYSRRVLSITREDVQRVASRYLQPERCTIVVAGPDLDESRTNIL